MRTAATQHVLLLKHQLSITKFGCPLLFKIAKHHIYWSVSLQSLLFLVTNFLPNTFYNKSSQTWLKLFWRYHTRSRKREGYYSQLLEELIKMTPLKRSFKVEARPVNRRSDMLIETQATSHSASESEYEERKSQLRRNRKRATRISGRRVIFQRGKADMRKAPQRAISVSSSSSSEESSDGNIGDEVEGEQGESPTPSSGLPLKWKGMVYPGVPVSPSLRLALVSVS